MAQIAVVFIRNTENEYGTVKITGLLSKYGSGTRFGFSEDTIVVFHFLLTKLQHRYSVNNILVMTGKKDSS